MLNRRIIPLLLSVLVLTGCASAPQQNSRWTIENKRPPATEQRSSFSFFGLFGSSQDVVEPDAEAEQEPVEDLAVDDAFYNREDLKGILYAQFREWRAVRYKLGGTTKKGIDCSAFVQLTYRDKFGIDLPRTTTYQSTAGHAISQNQLKPGDLVFFQVDRSTRHVGIYLENRKFMHVSSKVGVTVSSLDNVYWSKRYWKSVRVPDVLMAMRMN